MTNVLRRDEAGGKQIATETISSVEYPTVKLYDSTPGSTSPIGVSANPMAVATYNSLVPEKYDYISLSYTGSDLTGVVYKTGGSGGTTVATLTLAYSSGVLQTVTRT